MTVSLLMSHSPFNSIRDVVSTRPKGFSWFWLIVTQIYAGEPFFLGRLPDESLTLQSLIAVGTSAGGRQPKGIIAMNHETGEIRSGQVDLEPGS